MLLIIILISSLSFSIADWRISVTCQGMPFHVLSHKPNRKSILIAGNFQMKPGSKNSRLLPRFLSVLPGRWLKVAQEGTLPRHLCEVCSQTSSENSRGSLLPQGPEPCCVSPHDWLGNTWQEERWRGRTRRCVRAWLSWENGSTHRVHRTRLCTCFNVRYHRERTPFTAGWLTQKIEHA